MQPNSDSVTIQNNAEANRFEAPVGDSLAKIDYRRMDDRIILLHTEVPEAMQGQGIGSKLARFALDYARENDLQVDNRCPFIRSYLQEHPEYEDILV